MSCFTLRRSATIRDDTVRYVAGLDLLVLAGEMTITYNDMLGNSLQVPIITRTMITAPSTQ
jgi:hypothetical protein